MTASPIRELVERFRKAHPEDSREHREICERIRELRSDFEKPLEPEILRCLEAAGMLVSFLARMGGMAGSDVHAIAARLLDGALESETERTSAPAASGHSMIRKKAHPAGLASEASSTPAPSPEPTAIATATELVGEMMLGQILLHRGQVQEEHLQQAMRVQRMTSAPIGDILVTMNACTIEQLNDALGYQASLRHAREFLHQPTPPMPERVDSRGAGLKLVGEALLGETLVERGVVTRRQLESALEAQKQSGKRIGDALVEMGATTADAIEHTLLVQDRQHRAFNRSPQKSRGRPESR